MTFRWRGEPNERFEVELVEDRGFDHSVQRVGVTTNEATFQKPLSGVYYLRARGFDADNQSEPWNPPQRIDLPPPSWVFPAIGMAASLLLLF